MKASGLERIALLVAGGILVGVPLLDFSSIGRDVLACTAGAVLVTGVVAVVVLPDLHKEVRQKGELGRGYSVDALVLCFVLAFCFLLYEMHVKGRFER